MENTKTLNEKQRQDVRDWLAAGASLADVQRQLLEVHGIGMTYMDVRLMVLEMDAQVRDKPEPKPEKEEDADDTDGAGEEWADEEMPAGTGNVSISLDRVVQAGALASGTVRFSDGVSGSWIFDQMGRLSLTGMSQPDYRPSQEDVQAFQLELQRKLGGRG